MDEFDEFEHTVRTELNSVAAYTANAFGGSLADLEPEDKKARIKARESILTAHRTALELAERAARVAELKNLDWLTYSFMSLGNDFTYSYRQSAIDKRIAALTKEQHQ